MSVTTNQLTSTQLYCYDKNVNLFGKKYFIDQKTHLTFIPQLSKVRTTKKNILYNDIYIFDRESSSFGPSAMKIH